MSFAERAGINTAERPSCWGNKDAYDATDTECQDCRVQHSCRQEVINKGRVYQPVQPSRPQYAPTTGYRPSNVYADMYPSWAPGPIDEEDPPLMRLLKDGAIGGLHGMTMQWTRFFSVFRMR